MTAFDLSGSAWTSHTPGPSPEGRLEAAFFLVMRGLWRGDISPLERGFKGCVTVRGAAWVEGLRDTASGSLVLQGVISRLQMVAFDLSGCARA